MYVVHLDREQGAIWNGDGEGRTGKKENTEGCAAFGKIINDD